MSASPELIVAGLSAGGAAVATVLASLGKLARDIHSIRNEFRPNGGTTAMDQMIRVEGKLDALHKRLDTIETRVEGVERRRRETTSRKPQTKAPRASQAS